MAFQTIVEFVAHALEAMGMASSWLPAGRGDGQLRAAAGRRRCIRSRSTGVLRERLARATLLGLEFLVAADIIGTVAAVPTPARLLMLTGIILLRSFLNATLVLEVEGRWPWSGARRDGRRLPVQRATTRGSRAVT